MSSKQMDFTQKERETLVISLNARETKILQSMEDYLHQIANEKKASRVEKMLRGIFNDWHALQETRSLKERLHRTLDSDSHIKAVPK
ncbi:hypothetical protein GCM10011571_17650 [Marinithermofilum abyssi]|jgi:uncharacterized protein YhaN|uniref:Uncharacterized protein n=1 Tax=Marinithermofilum abyssi TaxID=1571185 RepID=A0A8J2VDQ9_9BACL|nr:hypothetical protein [Marinithermofilum abyssi]GGE16415.1 hypothetical protein GCM10011571_17650 [Marinithermofilum abyssi]